MKNNNKLPAFVIADNPMAEPPRTFVIHLRYPVVVAEVNPEAPNVLNGVWNEPLTEEWNDPLKMAGLMRRMGDWYHAYCKRYNYEEE